MEPIKFKQHNVVFAENQPEYRPLPALNFNDDRGTVVFCYRLTLKERIKMLFTGKLWVSKLTFKQPLQPIYMTVNRKEVFTTPEEK